MDKTKETIWFTSVNCKQLDKTVSTSVQKVLEEIEWNDGYWFEAMDRVWCTAHTIEELLFEHPAIMRAGLNDDIEAILTKMHNIYQAIGIAEFREEQKKKKK